MYSNTGRVKNLELPENLFSNLGELKLKNKDIQDNSLRVSKSGEYNQGSRVNVLSNKKDYRKRIDSMYNEIKGLRPIDNEIDNVIYFSDYNERGIVVKPRVSSLKQFWTEYRLIDNEHHTDERRLVDNDSGSLANFDLLFEELSKRVEEINGYIDELKEMRVAIDESNDKLKVEKNRLYEEKKEFMSYKNGEEEKIASEKENLKVNYDRLQTIINDLDKKLNEIDK